MALFTTARERKLSQEQATLAGPLAVQIPGGAPLPRAGAQGLTTVPVLPQDVPQQQQAQPRPGMEEAAQRQRRQGDRPRSILARGQEANIFRPMLRRGSLLDLVRRI